MHCKYHAQALYHNLCCLYLHTNVIFINNSNKGYRYNEGSVNGVGDAVLVLYIHRSLVLFNKRVSSIVLRLKHSEQIAIKTR